MGWVYVNGNFVLAQDAKVSVFDRGFLFADSVYEVTAVVAGHLVDFDGHYARLVRSCQMLGLSLSLSQDEMFAVHMDLITRNKLQEGVIYLQLTGGAAPRNFTIDRTLTPTLIVFSQASELIHNPKAKSGIKIITTPDLRWQRRDIKTTQLLSQSLARSAAQAAGVDDAWFVHEGDVNEGCSSNAFIITPEGEIVTRPASYEILSGITRQAVIDCAVEFDLTVSQRQFSITQAQLAREAFSTSASTFVMPVVEIDGVQIGNGQPGEVSRRLRELYIERVRRMSA